MTKTHKTTQKRVRSAKEIDFREIEDIVARAKDGDEIARAETEIMSKALKETIETSGIKEQLEKITLERSSDIIQNLVCAYIQYFNKEHGTTLETIDQLETYIQENDITIGKDISIGEILDTTAKRPKEYIHTVGKLTDLVFRDNFDAEKKGIRRDKVGKIFIDPDRKSVAVFASINYDEVLRNLGEESSFPEFSGDDRQVLDGIISNLVSGNKVMTYDMIYRGFSGKIDDGNHTYISDDIYKMIDNALDHFRGILKISSKGQKIKFKNGEPKQIFFDGPILHYDRLQTATINGKEINGEKIGLIIVHDFPSLYKFAKLGDEIDTRDIKILNVPKINNTPENLRIKRYLYYRVIGMKNKHEKDDNDGKNINKILFSTLFDYIGVTVTKDNSGRQKKRKILAKIETILSYWRDFGFISGYYLTHDKKSTSADGVRIRLQEIQIEEKIRQNI